MVKKLVIIMVLVAILATACGPAPTLSEGVAPYPDIPLPEGNGGEHFPPGSSYWPEPDIYAPYTWGELTAMNNGGLNLYLSEIAGCENQTVIAFEDEWELVSCNEPTADEFASALFVPVLGTTAWDSAPWVTERVIGALASAGTVVGVLVIASAAVYAMGTALAYNGGHSNPAHNPNESGSWANRQVWWLIASWTGLLAMQNGPRCGRWQDDGGRIRRYVFWVPRPDFGVGLGLIVWAHVKAGGVLGEFGGAYSGPQSSAGKVVQSLSDRNWTYIPMPCKSMPSPGNFFLPPMPPLSP